MEPRSGFIYKVGFSGKKVRPFTNLREWLKRELIRSKLDTEVGYLIFVAIAYLVGYLVATGGIVEGSLLAAGLVIFPTVIGALFHPRFGIYLMAILAFLVPFVKRLVPALPMGISMDVIMLVMLFGIYIKESRFRERNWGPLIHPMSIGMAVWALYCLVHGLFFYSGQLEKLVIGFRTVAGFVPLYFLGLYVFRELSRVDRLLQIWLSMAGLAMGYGFLQQIFGLAGWELAQVLERGPQADIMVGLGEFRKFSFLNDPAIFGLTMGGSGLVAWVLSFDPEKKGSTAWWLRLLALGMWVSGFFSGTRTMAIGLVVAALFYALLVLRAKGWLTFGGITAVIVAIMYLPVESPFVQRYRAVLTPWDTPSFVTRETNQQALQPLIQAFPLGAGPGAVEQWTSGVSKDSPLWQYPPESGFLILAVERGWVGLGLFIGLLWLIFFVGISRYAQVQDVRVQVRYEALLVFLAFLTSTHFLQKTFTGLPLSILFFISASLLLRMHTLPDQAEK